MQLRLRKLAAYSVTAHLLAVGGLLLLAYMTIKRSFSEFGFYYDDWRFLQETSQLGRVETVFATRPLHRPLTEWIFNTIGYNPATGYIFLAILLVASVLAMYWVMNAIFPRRRALAVMTATLYLLYPGDLSRTWITAGLTANRPAVLLALISLGLLFTGLRLRKRLPRLYIGLATISVLVYFTSLMLYEVQALLVLGLGFAGAIWIGISGRGLAHRGATRKMASNAARVVAPHTLIFIAVMIWRTLLVQFGTEDRFSATANFSPVYLVRQFIGVYYFNYLEQPLEVIGEGLPFLGQVGTSSLLLSIVGAILMVTAFLLFARSRTRRVRRSSPDFGKAVAAQTAVNVTESRFYLNVLVVALVLTGFVYLVLLPHDHIISASGLQGPFVSRLNAAGAVVVAIAGAAAVMLAWTWASDRWRANPMRVNVAAAGGIASVVILLVTFHGIVQRDYADAWQLQQLYANQIVETMPVVAPNTHFHLEGVPSRYGSSYVFMYSLEHMLRLIYDDATISATVDNDANGRYVLGKTGLFFDGEMVAPSENIERFRLYGIDCGDSPGPECGRLLIDGTRFDETSDRLLAVTPAAHNSEVEELLGIQSPVGTETTDEVSQKRPLFAAPLDESSQ